MQKQNSNTPMIWDVGQKCPSVCPFACNTITLQMVCLFVLLLYAMVMAGRSVHLTTLFPGQALTNSYSVLCAHTFACN